MTVNLSRKVHDPLEIHAKKGQCIKMAANSKKLYLKNDENTKPKIAPKYGQ